MFTITEILMIVELIIKSLLVPGLALLFKYLSEQTKNQRVKDAITRLEDFAKQAVLETSQTYVEDLKNTGEWTAETQEIAFQKSRDRLLQLAKPYLLEEVEIGVADLNAYINMLIEAAVHEQK